MQASAESPSASRTASVESLMHALLGIGADATARPRRHARHGVILAAEILGFIRTATRHRPGRLRKPRCLHRFPACRPTAYAGLIERTPDPLDGRAHRVKLSDAGSARIDAALRSRRALLEKSLESWNPRDLEELEQLLTRFAADVEALTQTMERA